MSDTDFVNGADTEEIRGITDDLPDDDYFMDKWNDRWRLGTILAIKDIINVIT